MIGEMNFNPASSGGVWVGAISALVAVFLTSAFNAWQQRTQRRHDARFKELDRASGLRKEVYLNAASDTARAMAALGSLPTAELTVLTEASVNLAASLAKVQVVGEGNTSRLAHQLGFEFSLAQLTLLKEVAPIRRLKFDIDNLNDRLRSAEEERARLIAALSRHTETLNQNKAEFNVLKEMAERQYVLVESLLNDRAKLWRQHSDGHADYSENLIERTLSVRLLHMDLMDAVREDLGLEPRSPEIKTEMVNQWEEIRVALHDFADALRPKD